MIIVQYYNSLYYALDLQAIFLNGHWLVGPGQFVEVYQKTNHDSRVKGRFFQSLLGMFHIITWEVMPLGTWTASLQTLAFWGIKTIRQWKPKVLPWSVLSKGHPLWESRRENHGSCLRVTVVVRPACVCQSPLGTSEILGANKGDIFRLQILFIIRRGQG